MSLGLIFALCCLFFYLGVTYARSKMGEPKPIIIYRTLKSETVSDPTFEEVESRSVSEEEEAPRVILKKPPKLETLKPPIVLKENEPISRDIFQEFKRERAHHRALYNIEPGTPGDLFFNDWANRN